MDLDSMLGKVHHNPKFIIHENKSSGSKTEMEEQIKLFDSITNHKDVNYDMKKSTDEVIDDLDSREFDPLAPSLGEKIDVDELKKAKEKLIKIQTGFVKPNI